jgi:D-sedoheptulose 7-phosphate isomerase
MTESTLGSGIGRLVDEFFAGRGRVFAGAAAACAESLAREGMILALGNGGSAAEAQHFVAELVNKFRRPRRGLRAVTLSADTSVLTSIGNDMSFEAVFSRQIETLGRKGDVVLALSTSGNSPNIVAALETARAHGLTTIALTGEGGGKLAPLCDFLLDVPSSETPRIQEVHLVAIHILTEEIESRLGLSRL